MCLCWSTIVGEWAQHRIAADHVEVVCRQKARNMAKNAALNSRCGKGRVDFDAAENGAVGDVQLASNLVYAAVTVTVAVVTADRAISNVQRECGIAFL